MAEKLIVTGNTVTYAGTTYRCAIGKNGFTNDKREGDGKSPLGMYALRECWWRPDRVKCPVTKLSLREIHENDGWSDDPSAPDYNRHVLLPYAYSHENLWREDHRYDLIIPLGYNDDPPVSGKGSAIFLHIAAEDWRGTQGCVALRTEALQALLPHFGPETYIDIREA